MSISCLRPLRTLITWIEGSPRSRRCLKIAAGLLLAGLLLSGLILGPFGVGAYLGGLLNRSPFGTALVALAGWSYLLVHGVRKLLASRGAIGSGTSKVVVFWAVVVGCIVASFILHSVGVYPAWMPRFARGFERRLQTRTDIDAIRAWLHALDPNDYADERPGSFVEVLDRADQPQDIARLRARVWLELDEAGRPKVRLAWDASKLGSWGLVIGDERMETPASDHSMYGERCLQLRPGVYFWEREG